MKNAFLDKLIGRLDRVDPQSLQSYVLKLAQEKGFLETLFNTIQEGIIVADTEGRIQYLNAAAGEFLGADPAVGRVIGEPVSRFLRDLDWDKLWGADQDEWHKVASHELEVEYPRHRILGFYIVPLLDEERGGLVSGLAVILRDNTEARRRTEHAIESEKISALTLLAAGVAHEIGNPLNSLNIHLQLMERDLKKLPAGPARRLRENLRVARDEIGRLDGIIVQFLHAIRPTQPQLERCAVNEVLRDALVLLEHEIKDRDLLLETELTDTLPPIRGDRAQLKQAFYNVIRNGIQAMQAGGILRVHSEATDTQVVVSVADTGGGIAPDQIGRLFEPYYTTKTKGTGLGLLIVQRIVREHGGTIDIQSDVGRGTTFQVRLPRQQRRTRLLAAAEPGAGRGTTETRPDRRSGPSA